MSSADLRAIGTNLVEHRDRAWGRRAQSEAMHPPRPGANRDQNGTDPGSRRWNAGLRLFFGPGLVPVLGQEGAIPGNPEQQDAGIDGGRIALERSRRVSIFEGRRHPDSNRGWRFCRPLPYHLAMAPWVRNAPGLYDTGARVSSGRRAAAGGHRR